MKEEHWIKERIFKNKYEELLKELSKDLNNILVCYKYDGKNRSLNKLKLDLTKKMDWYKERIFRNKKGGVL